MLSITLYHTFVAPGTTFLEYLGPCTGSCRGMLHAERSAELNILWYAMWFPHLTAADFAPNAAVRYYNDSAGKNLNSLAENEQAPSAMLVHLHKGTLVTEAFENDRFRPYPPAPEPGLTPSAPASSPPPPDDSWPPPLDPPSHPELSTADAIEVRWDSKITALQPAELRLTDVGSLRHHLAAERGLPLSQLRLQCGSSELFDDSESLSVVDAMVLVTLRGGLPGGTIVVPKQSHKQPASPVSLSLKRKRGSGVDPPTLPARRVSADAEEALKAAARRFSGKVKVSELHFAALTAATRTADVLCDPLTAESDLPTIGEACKAIELVLAAVDDVKTKKQRAALQDELKYPSPQLKEAFKAHLRAEAAQAGGGLVEVAVEAELAARRADIVSSLIQPADAPAHAKLKDLFRRIRADHYSAWVASCGTELEKADAALDMLTADGRATAQMPQSVVDKWQAALVAARGEGCKFKPRSQCSPPIKGLHLYRFELAGATSSADLPPLFAQQ